MSRKTDKTYLRHILDSIFVIEDHTKGVDRKAFFKNKLVQGGVIRELEIIGEAAKRLSDEFRREHNLIPWKDIAGMRDKLIHDYFDVDLDAVWETVERDIPTLKSQVKEILDS